MSIYIKLDNEDDFKWLKDYILTWRKRSQDNVAAYVEHIEMFERLANAFESAEKGISVPSSTTIQPPLKATRKSRREAKAIRPNLCEIHPLYEAKRWPRTGCTVCEGQFERLNGKAVADLARRKAERKKKLNGN